MYQRKTRDEWHIEVNYGYGWEHEVTEDSWREAREQLRTHRANCQYAVRAVKRRVHVTADESRALASGGKVVR